MTRQRRVSDLWSATKISLSLPCWCSKHLVELNIDEKLPGSSEHVTIESLRQDGFGDVKFFSALVVDAVKPEEQLPKTTEENCTTQNCVTEERTTQSPRLLGYATYSFCYGTYGPGRVLSLQDIFVEKKHRRTGIGKALFTEVAKVALTTKCQEITWHAFSWNNDAVSFYNHIGATDDTVKLRQHVFSMDHKDMTRLVTEEDKRSPFV